MTEPAARDGEPGERRPGSGRKAGRGARLYRRTRPAVVVP